MTARHALVFGASGLIGRELVRTLLDHGLRVTAATRSEDSADRLQQWLAAHGADRAATVRVDFTDAALLPGGQTAFADVTEIHNCAGSYRFGMTIDEARSANVDSVGRLLDFAAGLPDLDRLVHVSGYRVGGQDPTGVPWSADRIRTTYRRLGAYEGSKVESDAVLQARASAVGVPWTVVNPSSVIGHSVTGESDQYLGLAASLRELWRGRMPALPGNSDTFVPVVPVDYLAAFMAAVTTDPDATGRSYWVLADDTPPLPDLLAMVAVRYGRRVPRLRVPVGLLRRLPASVSRTDPETLTFLSSDRYPTASADAFAAAHRLTKPDIRAAILAWADQLAAHRFGDAPVG